MVCLAFELLIGSVTSVGAVTVTSASAVTAGARAAQVMLGALGDADSGFSGCDSQENYNFNAHQWRRKRLGSFELSYRCGIYHPQRQCELG